MTITVRHIIEVGGAFEQETQRSLKEVWKAIHALASTMKEFNTLQTEFGINQIKTMTTLQDIKQAIAAQNEAITAEIEQVNAKLDELAAAGSDAERAEIVSQLQASTARITGIIADAPTGNTEPGSGDGGGTPGETEPGTGSNPFEPTEDDDNGAGMPGEIEGT